MGGILLDLFQELSASIFEAWGLVFVNIAETALFIENTFSDIFGTATLQELYAHIIGVGASFLVLKVLRKGFLVYVLWRDGDSETSPLNMIIGSGMAVFITVAFPQLYPKFANVTLWFSRTITGIMFGHSDMDSMASIQDIVVSGVAPLFNIIFILIFQIMLLYLYYQYLRRGVELLIMRLAVPFACIGLIESDDGAFKPYMQQFVKSFFAVIAQTFCISAALASVRNGKIGYLILGCAVLGAAIKMPQMLQQFLLPGSGGGAGLGYKISTGANMVRSVSSLFGK